MTKKPKTNAASKEKPAKPHVISQLRIGSVLTEHGTFLRLMIVQTTDGVVTDMQALNNYFNDAHEIENLLHSAAGALQMPVVDVDMTERRN
jgi:hypothetical protein